MPNPEAAEAIAANLFMLPNDVDPSTPLMFPLHAANFPGSTEEHQQHMGAMNKGIGAGIVAVLENNGFAVVRKADLPSAPILGSSRVTSIHCKICGGVLIEVLIGPDGKGSIPPRVINPDCEARHGAGA